MTYSESYWMTGRAQGHLQSSLASTVANGLTEKVGSLKGRIERRWPSRASSFRSLSETAAKALRLSRYVEAAALFAGICGGTHRTVLERKSDLRNHRTIVRPRSYDGAMVTQITLKTEGPHGFPSDDTPAEADPGPH
jgi:hypothetical protein